MTEKYRPINHQDSSFLSNELIEENYNNLVLEKITKELFDSRNGNSCCESCDDKKPSENNLVQDTRNIILAKCKGLLGIHFCDNTKNLQIKLNENIIIKIENEFEFATVIETGKIVNFKKDKSESENDCFPIIDRIATDKDFDRNVTNIANSHEAKKVFLELISELSLDMKLVDIHFQFDRKKLFFFYTADGRVDFRELAKRLAATFKTRIELRQIGVRDEAKRLGGLATCGREFCCSSFLNNFKRITTDIAVENNISTSISKYTGPCGKLKCCLSFEL